jgi:hypothetical protein
LHPLASIIIFYLLTTFHTTSAALLKAVYVVDTDALLEVIEETEATQQLSEELRNKVRII